MYSAVSANYKEQTKYKRWYSVYDCTPYSTFMYVCMRSLCRYLLKAASPLVWQANLIVVLSCLFFFCQKSKKGTLTEYANALVHCLTCSIDAKRINMQTTCKIYIALSIRKFDSLLHLPFTAFQLQYSRTVSSRVHIYVYAHDKS